MEEIKNNKLKIEFNRYRDYLIIITIGFIINFRAVIGFLSGKIDGGGDGDMGQAMWWISEISRKIFSLENPFFTDRGNYPSGINSLWNQSLIGYGTLFAPITMIFGALFTLSLLLILIPIINGVVAFLFFKEIKSRNKLLFAILFAYGPLLPLHIRGHLNIASYFIVLLLPLLFIRYIREKRGLLYFTLVFILSFTVSSELTLYGCILTTILIAKMKIYQSKNFLQNSIKLASLATITVLPIVILMLGGPQSVRGPVQEANLWKNSLLQFLLPSHYQVINLNNSVGEYGASHEGIGYLGIGLVVAIILCFLRERRYFYLLAGMATYILSLGPTLHFLEERNFWMPFNLLSHIPVVNNLLPGRLSILTFIFFLLHLKDYNISKLLTIVILLTTIVRPIDYDLSRVKSLFDKESCDNYRNKVLYIAPLPRPGYVGGMMEQVRCKNNFKLYGTYNIIRSLENPEKAVWSNIDATDLIIFKSYGVDFGVKEEIRVSKNEFLQKFKRSRVDYIIIDKKYRSTEMILDNIYKEKFIKEKYIEYRVK